WKLYLSPGNHYSGWHQLYKKVLKENYPFLPENAEVYPLEYEIYPGKTVIFMPNLYETYVGKQAVVQGHYPVYPHNGAGKGVWGIYGHCHGNNPATHKLTGKGKVL